MNLKKRCFTALPARDGAAVDLNTKDTEVASMLCPQAARCSSVLHAMTLIVFVSEGGRGDARRAGERNVNARRAASDTRERH